MLEMIHDILHFWFGENEAQLHEKAQKWWIKDPVFDQNIREKFEFLLEKAQDGSLDIWRQQPKSCLAYIILCDQFPRNIYRGSPKAFDFDPLALEACHAGLEHEFDKDLSLLERQFFYMPLQHSENLEDQNLSVMLFKKLLEHAEAFESSKVMMMQNAYNFAVRHYEIIAQFGRFPHRNAALNRPLTEQEKHFLALPNSFLFKELYAEGRIRVACRRGMLELDLFLLPFFEAVYPTLTEQEQEIFQRLLEESDQQLQRWLYDLELPPKNQRGLIAKIQQHHKRS